MPFDPIPLSQSANPLGGHYLARVGPGFLAGRTQFTALPFDSARAVYEHFRPLADTGEHWAWNICYQVESLVA